MAEVWVPLWERPMTAREVVAMFQRGRAEVRGRGVLTPSAFATAIMRRGVDAGITEFRRFALVRTTSANTFEPRFEGSYRVRATDATVSAHSRESFGPASLALERLLALRDQLPADRKVGKRWRFVGLRGELEAAMLRLAAGPSDSEGAYALLDAATAALDRVDRNRSFRERRIAWEPLPVAWVPALFNDTPPNREARLALALVSGFPTDQPCAFYRFGVEMERGGRLVHPETSPARWIWRAGVPLPRLLAEILQRRTIDWEEESRRGGKIEPARLLMPAADLDVDEWLAGRADDGLLSRWISRLCLFNWSEVPPAVRAIARRSDQRRGASGRLCLFGLLSPLFDLREVSHFDGRSENLLPIMSGARTPGAARRLLGMLRTNDVPAAVTFACGRYAMAGAPLVKSDIKWDVAEPDRLAGSLLFSVGKSERGALVERWLRPFRKNEV